MAITTPTTGDGSTKPSTYSLATAFDGANLGTTLGGIGSGIELITGIINSNRDNRMRKKLYKMEKARVERANEIEDKFHDEMVSAWGKQK